MEKLPTRVEHRIEELKEAYIEDDLSEQDFYTLLDAAFDDDAPFSGGVPDEDEIEEVEREEVELSDEAKAKEDELRDKLGLGDS